MSLSIYEHCAMRSRTCSGTECAGAALLAAVYLFVRTWASSDKATGAHWWFHRCKQDSFIHTANCAWSQRRRASTRCAGRQMTFTQAFINATLELMLNTEQQWRGDELWPVYLLIYRTVITNFFHPGRAPTSHKLAQHLQQGGETPVRLKRSIYTPRNITVYRG